MARVTARHDQRSLASRAAKKLMDLATELMNLPNNKEAGDFYRNIAEVLGQILLWLKTPSSATMPDKVTSLLIKLDAICAYPRKPHGRQSTLHTQRFPNLDALYITALRRGDNGLERLAASKSGRQSRKEILDGLNALVRVEASETAAEEPHGGGGTPFDCNNQMEALYQALLKHKYCFDRHTKTYETLTTQLCLSTPPANGANPCLRVSLLFQAHKHTNLAGTPQDRMWKDAELNVFCWRQNSASLLQVPLGQTPPATSTVSSRPVGLKTNEFCGHISGGMISQLLVLEVRDEILVFKKTSARETKWALNAPSITLNRIIGDQDFLEQHGSFMAPLGWIPRGRTKDDIRFAWASPNEESEAELYVDSPFLYRSIDDPDQEDPCSYHPHPKILGLGILLLEVALSLKIEENRLDRELSANGPSAETDFLASSRLCKEEIRWSNRDKLRSVIKVCVGGLKFAGITASDFQQVRHVLLTHVVHPLEALWRSESEAQRLGAGPVRIPDAYRKFGAFIASRSSGSAVSPMLDQRQVLRVDPSQHAQEVQNLNVAQDQHEDLKTPSNGGGPSRERALPSRPTVQPEMGWLDRMDSFVQQEQSGEDKFDGRMFTITEASHTLTQPRTFDELNRTWKARLEFQEKDKYVGGDKIVKVAVLDTGIDLLHEDFQKPRAESFANGQPVSAEGEMPQIDRIKGRINYIGDETGLDERNVQDLDGHGTQVAGIILRLAPKAELYIARICEGDVNFGVAEGDKQAVDGRVRIVNPRPEAVVKAIEWAIQMEVDIINMSFGFRCRVPSIASALKLARDKGILVFAAMANEGMNKPAAWPAKKRKEAIGIHSCIPSGKSASKFTPNRVKNNENFMVVGENIPAHWITSKGGGFRITEGTSFATPVAVAMAALVLAFANQSRFKCVAERKKIEALVDVKGLWENSGMIDLLDKVSEKSPDGYKWIYPQLLWRKYPENGEQETLDTSRAHGWKTIRKALE